MTSAAPREKKQPVPETLDYRQKRNRMFSGKGVVAAAQSAARPSVRPSGSPKPRVRPLAACTSTAAVRRQRGAAAQFCRSAPYSMRQKVGR